MQLDPVLKLMAQQKASDLFITAGRPPSVKLHGKLQPIGSDALSEEKSLEMVMSALSAEQQEEFQRTKESNCALKRDGIGRFRVSAFMQRDAAGMVVRRIETEIPTLEDLALPEALRDLVMLKRGIVFVVGATGAGKSTTLAAMVGHRNRNSSGHIITVEDPVEFVHEHAGCIITQREVGVDTESYEVALRNTLRQAPDVILIGEIRTAEVMQHAISFAETGHLVLATLHANNANQALDRILHFFPENERERMQMDLSLNLRGVVAQQLVRRPDGKSRRAVIEILLSSPMTSELIRKGEVERLKEAMKKSNEQGMVTFDQALAALFKKGEIAQDDAMRHADSPNELRSLMRSGERMSAAARGGLNMGMGGGAGGRGR